MRLALIHVGQETNDFNPVPTTLRDYQAFGVYEGAEIFRHLGKLGQVGGYYTAVEECGRAIETIPIIRAWAVAGGRIDRESFDFFQRKISDGLRAAGRIDGLALQLHGACAAEHDDDVEGAQIALCRKILGPDVPIVLQLDHHANVTRRMVENATAIVAHRTQPHDPFDTGLIGTRLLLRICAGEVSPRMAFRKIPLLSHQEQFLTKQPPMKTWFDHARAAEADPRVLHIAPCPMQPWLDAAEGGWSVVVVTDSDQALAEKLADESADLAWSLRAEFQRREAVAIDEAVRRADAADRGVVVLSDTGDTVFGGSTGDSNLILEAMLRLGIKGPALVPLIEPPTAARLFAAGEGATLTLPVGGSAATAFFRPLSVTGVVRKLADGRIRVTDSHQPDIDMGRTALFQVGPVLLLVSELRGLAGNHPDVYRAFGIEPSDYRMAVVKTASNFQYFAPITSEMIRVDTRGPGQSDVHSLPWRRLPRPIYPLDDIADWRAGGTAHQPSTQGELTTP
jgi:microcystin degradation protein MlrC